ncbi:MAG: cytochrome c oxidase assembly protein [Rhizobiaceae bacterium]|nr:cytochrome c oxidase assembly protein [Rhizobiaceae bacterium]
MTEVPNKSAGGNIRTVAVCLGVTFGMLGMAYAAVPLYQIFCQVTGYAGTTQRAEDTTGTVLDKTINVRFDSNIATDLDWEFAPKQREITLKLGEKATAFYTASNFGKTDSYGTATFNVSPGAAGIYFNKIDCFCFTEQKLAAGETVDMPVLFFVDPEIVNDPLLKDATTITLSYTFFPDEDAEQEVTENAPSDKDGTTLKSSL